MQTKRGVYGIYCSTNDKIYIGQASDILLRWRQHRNMLKQGIHFNSHLQSAWNKYGEDAFRFEVLHECSEEDLGKQEIFYLEHVPEEKRFNKGPAGYSPTLGLAHSDLSKLRQSRARGGRPVIATEIVSGKKTRFEWIGEAARLLNIHQAHIDGCVRGQRKTANGYTFESDPSVPANPQWKSKERNLREKRNRAVIAMDALGAEKHFPFIAAVREGGFLPSGVYKCLSGIMSTHREHTWRYADGQPHRTMSEAHKKTLIIGPRKHQGSRSVIGTSASGKEVHFEYVQQAATMLKIAAPSIHACLKGRLQTAGGYSWRYTDPNA